MSDNAASRAARLLDLVPFIVNNPGISIRDLSVEFGIPKEEMLKDLNLLFMCGLPGYTPLELIDISFDDDIVEVRDPQNLIAPRKLTESESLITRIALAALEEMTEGRGSSRARIAAVREKLATAFNSAIPDGSLLISLDVNLVSLAKIKEAIESGSDCEITYTNLTKDEISRRKISPLSLNLETDRTLVEAYCHKADGRRTFILQQISDVTIVQRADRTTPEVISESQGSVATLVINDVDSDFAQRNRSALTSLGQGRFEMKIYQPEWLVRTVMRSPDVLAIESPVPLRQSVLNYAEKALKNYESAT